MKILERMLRTLVAGTFLLSIFLVSTTDSNAQDWKAPAEYKSMKNTMAGKADADNVGKALYDEHCKSCHGKEGYGDGKKAGELDTEMRDLSASEVQSQTDGELYYKSIIGQDEMPNYEKKISSKEDRWLLINYLRKLKE